jgi:hypothetical protein
VHFVLCARPHHLIVMDTIKLVILFIPMISIL